MWRLTRQLNELSSDFNIDKLLNDINNFLIGYSLLNHTPSSEDKPYRTVKTILYHLTKNLKSEVSCSNHTHFIHHIRSLLGVTTSFIN